MSNSCIWPIGRTLSGTTTPGQSGPQSDENEEVLYISQRFNITGASPSDCFVSYPVHLLEEFNPSAELQSVGQYILYVHEYIYIYSLEIHFNKSGLFL